MGANHSTEEQADRRGDAILEAVGFAAARFLRTASWEDEALSVLAHLGAATEVSRAYVFEDDAPDGEGRVARLLFEWSAPGVESQTGNPVLQHRPMGAEGWDRWERALAAGDAVHGLVRDLPAGQRAVFEPQGIVSIACVPVFVGGRWWGHMGFDDCRAERAWSERELSALRAAADVLGAAIERRRTEQGLRQAEARYRALIEQIPAITYLDSQGEPGARYELGRTLYVSPQIEGILGWPPEDWLGDSDLWEERLHPDDRERVIEEWRRLQAAGERFRCRFRMIARDGRTVWFEENDTMVRDEHSGTELIQGVMHDITGLQEAGEVLRRRLDALEVVYRLSDAVTRAEGVEGVYDEALDGLLRAVGADRAAVLLFDEEGVMRFKAWRGLSEGYRRQAEGHSPWPRDARDPEPALVPDVEQEPRLAPLRETILGEGIRALGAVPLVRQGRPVGKLMAYFDAPHAFSAEEVRLAEAIAGHVAFAIERRRAEQGLREAESLYRTLAEQIPAVTFVEKWDEDWTPIYVSPGIEELSGYPVERWLESTQFWIDRVHPDDRERVLAEASRAYEQELSTSIEYRLVHSDGRVVWIHEEDALIRDEQGVPQLSQGIMLDITERRVAADALRASEARYRTLAEQIPAATYVVRRDGHSTPVYWSPRIEELTGFPPERWMSSPGFWVERIHPDDRERALAEERGSYAEQRPFRCEYRLVAADGREVWVRDENALIRDEAGVPELCQGIILDITERRAAAEALAASEARYRSLYEDSPIAIAIQDFSKVVARLEQLVAGGVTDVAAYLEEHPEVVRECAALAETVDANHAAVELFGAGSRAELLGPVAPFFPAAALEWLRGELAGVAAGEPSRRVETALRTVSGGHRLMSMSWIPAPGHEEDLGRVWSYFQDITERKAAEDALSESERRFKGAFADAGVGMTMASADGRLLHVNRAFCDMVGYTEEELLELDLGSITHADDRSAAGAAMERLMAGESDALELELRYLRSDGSVIWGLASFSLVRDAEGEPAYAVAQVQDVTERKRQEERIAYLAYHDELTGLPNRTMFQEQLAMALARARRHDLSLAVLYLDLDRFKLVNDSLGHAAGDAVLAQVGGRLHDITRAEDMIARHSGDEFLLLLADLDPVSARDAVEAAAAKAHRALREPFRAAGQEFSIDASIGASVFPAQAEDAESLVRHADMAMYESKRSGPGGTLVFAGSGRDSAARLSLAGRLRRAIERDELELHYQPIVELARVGEDGARPLAHALGVEALIRWRDSERGLLVPGQFITEAEEAGLSADISDWVVDQAARQAEDLRAQGLDLTVSINLSARQLRPALVEHLCERVAAAGSEPARLMIELTESAAMADPELTRDVVRDLAQRGFRLAIDDFGAGHSSLSRLIQLDMPIEVLKLDRAFIEPIPESEVSSTVVVGMIQVARALGMRPLAEGIETEEQLRFLVESGCDLGQGFYMSPPVPAAELLALAGV